MRLNPFCVAGTSMQPNTLLLVKLTFVLLVIERFPHELQEPYLPFLPVLDALRGIEWYAPTLHVLFFGAGSLLVFNLLVRPASITLGAVVLLANLQSEPAFRNHLVICGCVLLLAGLERPRAEPVLLRWQMVVVYLGAWLNKQLEPDWLTGRVFDNWMEARLVHRPYLWLAGLLPDGVLGLICSWVTMGSEFLVMVGLAVRRWWRPAILFGLWFHFATFVALKGNPFGHFVQSLGIAYLAFLTWPRSEITVTWPTGRGWLAALRRGLAATDFDRNLRWLESAPDERAVAIQYGDRHERGLPALCSLLLYTPIFYWLLLGYLSVCLHAIPWPGSFILSSMVCGFLLLVFTVSALRSNDGWRIFRAATA